MERFCQSHLQIAVNIRTPFPEELVDRFINLYSYKDELILDPFMGSGTTALAALNSNRKYVGYEINKEYCDLANKRIKDR